MIRNIWAIAWREIRSYFVSPIAYVVMSGFGILTGWIFFNLLGRFMQMATIYRQFGNPQMMQQLNLHDMVVQPTFMNITIILILMFPALSMRVLAEERRQGTDELLLTSPLSTGQIVVGKFVAIMAVFMGMLSMTAPFFGVLVWKGNPGVAQIGAGYLGLFCMGATFAAIGTFTSSLTRNQVIAAVSCFVVLLMMYVIDWISASSSGLVREVLQFISFVRRYADFVKGIVDVRNLMYFASVTAFALYLSKASLDFLRTK